MAFTPPDKPPRSISLPRHAQLGGSTEAQAIPAVGGWGHKARSPSAPHPWLILRTPNRFHKTLLASWLFVTQLN